MALLPWGLCFLRSGDGSIFTSLSILWRVGSRTPFLAGCATFDFVVAVGLVCGLGHFRKVFLGALGGTDDGADRISGGVCVGRGRVSSFTG